MQAKVFLSQSAGSLNEYLMSLQGVLKDDPAA
jgi:hypothetical protein